MTILTPTTIIKAVITEGRDAPLYHSTMPENFEAIAKEGIRPVTYHAYAKLMLKKPGPWHSDHQAGISATRSFGFAKRWGDLVFELDQAKLARQFRIIPIQYFQAAGNPARPKGDRTIDVNEYEEFILTPKPLNLKQYCRAIYIRDLWMANHFITTDLWDGPVYNYEKQPIR